MSFYHQNNKRTANKCSKRQTVSEMYSQKYVILLFNINIDRCMIMENKWIKRNLRHMQLNIKCVYSEAGKIEKWKLVIN